ncbi:MAG: PKD domain-containing protein [Methanomicrobiales archaeon]
MNFGTTLNPEPEPVKPVVHLEPPDAAIDTSSDSGPAPLEVRFTDSSTGTIASRTWEFERGYKSEDPEVNYTFKNPGTYLVKLTVSNAGGSDSTTKTIRVTDPLTSGGGGEGTLVDKNVDSTTNSDTHTVDNVIPPPPPPPPVTNTDIPVSIAAAVAGVIGGLTALGGGLAGTTMTRIFEHQWDQLTEQIEKVKLHIRQVEDRYVVIDADTAATYDLPEGTCQPRPPFDDEAATKFDVEYCGPGTQKQEWVQEDERELAELYKTRNRVEESLRSVNIQSLAKKKIPELHREVWELDSKREDLAWNNIDDGRDTWRVKEIDSITGEIDTLNSEIRRWRRNLTGVDNAEMRIREMNNEIGYLQQKKEMIIEKSHVRRIFPDFQSSGGMRDQSYDVNKEYRDVKVQAIDAKIADLEQKVGKMEKRTF